MALSLESWQSKAQGIRQGEKRRVQHDCGPGRTLLINSSEQGISAYCFRCSDSGWLPPPVVPLQERIARLGKLAGADQSAPRNPTTLPGPRVPWSEWPAQARLWFLKAGLGAHDAGRLGAYYHPGTERVVLPVLGPSGPLFWQARAVDGRQPKYLSPDQPGAGVLPRWGTAGAVTLTEDLLSAYKVGTSGHEGWCLMGTSLKANTLAALLREGKPVNVWLDPDAAGQRAASKVSKQLRAVGLSVRSIKSARDPKLLHRAQIKEILSWDFK